MVPKSLPEEPKKLPGFGKNPPGTFADAGVVPKRAPESILEPPGVHVGASGVDLRRKRADFL